MGLSKRYTEEVRRVFKTIKAPYPNFIVDMVEYDARDYLELRIYRDNVESFSQPQKVALAEYLFQLRDAIRQCNVKCHIQGVEHAPPDKRG